MTEPLRSSPDRRRARDGQKGRSTAPAPAPAAPAPNRPPPRPPIPPPSERRTPDLSPGPGPEPGPGRDDDRPSRSPIPRPPRAAQVGLTAVITIAVVDVLRRAMAMAPGQGAGAARPPVPFLDAAPGAWLPVAPFIAVALTACLLWFVHSHNPAGLPLAAALAPLLLMSYLARLGATGSPTAPALAVFLLAVGGFVLAAQLRWHLTAAPVGGARTRAASARFARGPGVPRRSDPSLPHRDGAGPVGPLHLGRRDPLGETDWRLLLGLIYLTATAGACTVLAPTYATWSRVRPTLLGLRPVEVLTTGLLGLVVVLLARTPAPRPRPGGRFLGPDAATVVLWAFAAPVGLFALTGDLGPALVLGIGVLTAVGLWSRSWRHPAVGTVAGAAIGGAAALLVGLAHRPLAGRIAPAWATDDPPGLAAAARGAIGGATWTGPGPLATGTGAGARPVRDELAVALVGEQWGYLGVAAALIAVTVFLLLLVRLVRRQCRTPGDRSASAAAALAATVVAGLVLTPLAILFGLDGLRTTMPFLSGDPTSLVLTLTLLGFIVAGPAHRR